MDSAYKLAIEIVANAKNFEVNINKAGESVDNVVEKTKEAVGENSQLAGSFQGISAAAGKAMGILAAVGGTLAFLKSSVEAVEGPGDRFEEVIEGAKSAVFEFQRSLVTTDFSNFLENLKQGYIRGKEFAAAMDELKDISAYGDYLIAQSRAQSVELQETIKNKTLDLSVRRKYAEDRNKIEEGIMNRTQDLATKRFILEKENWEKINKMSAEQAIKLYEFVDNLTGEEATKMSNAFKRAEDQMGWKNKKGVVNVVMGQTGFSRGSVEAYKEYLDLMRTGEADVLPKLFQIYKNINTVRFESQRTYNLAVRETSMLLNQEDKVTKGLVDTLGELKNKMNETSLGYKIGTDLTNVVKGGGTAGMAQIKQPGQQFNRHLILPDDINKLREYKGLTSEQVAEMNKLAEATDTVADKMDRFATMVLEGGNSFKEYAGKVKSAIKETIGAFIAEGVAAMVGNALKASAKMGPIGLVLAPALAAMAGGLARTAFNSLIPKFAEGGLVYGPTLAHVGEYQGAGRDPEVISPLSKLKGMLGNMQPVPQRVALSLGSGGALEGYLQYSQNKYNNYK